MPANLNALIRYRTIDKCLSNPYRKWTIADLMEACSKALEENRGIYSGISERTIREDIRVMRSDILGFNAPIVQKEGNYSYENPSYSIFKVNIHERDLLGRVLNFIREIQSEIQHPDMKDIIDRISQVISEPEELGKPAPGEDVFTRTMPSILRDPSEEDLLFEESQMLGPEEPESEEISGITWAYILGLTFKEVKSNKSK